MKSFLYALTLSLLFAEVPAFGDAADTGQATVSGTILYSGRIPRPSMGGVAPPAPIDDPAAYGLEFVFVGLMPLDATKPDEALRPEAVPGPKMDQINYLFVPKVLAVREGQLVIFGNGDATNHSVRVISDNRDNLFNVITRPDHTYEHRFVRQSTDAPIRLACDFHPSMIAWIYVVDYPYFAVTDEDGHFDFGAVEPGAYRLVVRDPEYRMRAEEDLRIAPGQTVTIETGFGIPNRHYRAEPPFRILAVPEKSESAERLN